MESSNSIIYCVENYQRKFCGFIAKVKHFISMCTCEIEQCILATLVLSRFNNPKKDDLLIMKDLNSFNICVF